MRDPVVVGIVIIIFIFILRRIYDDFVRVLIRVTFIIRKLVRGERIVLRCLRIKR